MTTMGKYGDDVIEREGKLSCAIKLINFSKNNY